MLIIDNSCAQVCNSKIFVYIGTCGRHRGLSTIYIKQNLFHQSIIGRDVELQNIHIVLFKSLRDVTQVSTLSAKFDLGSKLVDWCRDATSVVYGHLLIYLSPRAEGRLRYCINTGSLPSKFYVPQRLKHLKSLEDEHTKGLYSPSVPITVPQMQKSFHPLLYKRVLPDSLRLHIKSAQR